MARIKQRRPKKRISRFTMFGIVVLSLVMCGILMYKKHDLKLQANEYQKQIVQLKAEKKKADDRKEELKDYKEYVNTDEFVEEVAREKLGLVHKNEIIFEPDNAEN